MKKLFGHLLVAAWFLIPFVSFGATPPEAVKVSLPVNGPVKVHVTIFIIDVDEIKNVNQSFDANVGYQHKVDTLLQNCEKLATEII